MSPLAIVVPVYNGFEGLGRCLDSLARWRPAESTIILVNDASSDARVLPKLREFERAGPHVQLIAAAENRGFVVSANRGAAAAPAAADLLFLNADTEVTRGWADEMRAALDGFPDAAVCCPLSNNATILSVPQFQQDNSLPFDWDADRTASFLRECAGDLRAVPIPTPVGFCMLVRRDAWDRFGPFDEAFGRGYGEEDDFGQRVQAAGRAVICAPRAFVYHEGAASFGATPALAESRRANNQLLLSRWPDYDEKTRAWCRENPLRPLHEKIWHRLLTPAGMRPIHVLHLVKHWQMAGALRSNITDIVDATQDFAIHTVLVPTAERGAWMDAIDFESEENLRVVGLIEMEKRFDRFLAASPADLVHVHDGGEWLSRDLVERARAKRPMLLTPGEVVDPARCAQVYRQVQA
jgi:GT2 family glycosyltransferase